jgi:hypothetical protein
MKCGYPAHHLRSLSSNVISKCSAGAFTVSGMRLPVVAGILLVAAAIGLWHFSRKCQRMWKLLARVSALALISIAALLTLLSLVGGSMCGRYDFPPVPSPDGLSMASVSEEDCGATDSFHSSVQLSLRKRGVATVFTIGHDPRLIELEWRGANLLAIRYPNDSRTPEEFRCQSAWDEVQIECVAYTPDYSKPLATMPPVKRGFR